MPAIKFDLGTAVILGIGGYAFLATTGLDDAILGRFTGQPPMTSLAVHQASDDMANLINTHQRRFQPEYVSLEGLTLIRSFEGFSATPYKDAAGVLTIGYGHTKTAHKYSLITKQQAEDLLRQDIEPFERAVSRYVRVPLTQNEYDALVSLAYNIGVNGFAKSSLLKDLNQDNRLAAADHFRDWVHAGGRKNEGLKRRRDVERQVFLNS